MALGSALQRQTDYGPLADMVSQMRESITADVTARLATEIASAVASAVARSMTPQVNVAPAQITVAAPNVTITPTLTMEGEDNAGEIAAMNANTEVLKEISNQLGTLIKLASTPVTTTVERGANQLITRTVESR